MVLYSMLMIFRIPKPWQFSNICIDTRSHTLGHCKYIFIDHNRGNSKRKYRRRCLDGNIPERYAWRWTVEHPLVSLSCFDWPPLHWQLLEVISWLVLRSSFRPGQGTHQWPFCLANSLGIAPKDISYSFHSLLATTTLMSKMFLHHYIDVENVHCFNM